MPLTDPLPITPFARPARGAVVVPGSKSITNRVLLLAAMSDGPVVLNGALFSDDTRIMTEALVRLGIEVEEDKAARRLTVHGRGGAIPAESAELHVGLAGTAARFLTALCASAPRGCYRIGGTPQMNRRPMKGLIDALRVMGARILCTGSEGFLPVEIHARGLGGGPASIDAGESSQMLSALLMASRLAAGDVSLSLVRPVREPFVAMTAGLIRQFGGEVSLAEGGAGPWTIRAGSYRSPGTLEIEPDASAASYFLPCLSQPAVAWRSPDCASMAEPCRGIPRLRACCGGSAQRLSRPRPASKPPIPTKARAGPSRRISAGSRTRS